MLKRILHSCVFILCLFCLIGSYQAQGQVHRKKQAHASGSPTNDFEKTQFYIGIRGGINLTKANVIQSYSSFASPTDPNETYKKSYKDYAKPAGTFGLEFSFSFQKFTVVVP